MIVKILTASAFALGMAACASAPAPQMADARATDAKPTHYWTSSTKSSQNRYRVDNLACQSQTQADQGDAVFEPGTDSFDAYRDCMVSRGYVLRQY